jgi:uncharacterized protein
MHETGRVSATATPIQSAAVAKVSSLRYWKIYVTVFLVGWLVVVAGFGYAREVSQHWPMSLVMIAGSLVAGSTPMGGGTVAFPILVLLFNEAPANARNFGLIIQALGMTSAMLFIIGRKVPVPVRVLTGSTGGAALGFVIGTYLIGPYVAASFVKLLFSCLWMSFGVLTLLKNSEICSLKGRGPADNARSEMFGLAAGLVGGTMASMIGVGVEMCVYTMMVLYFRADLKVAIPTAVCAAALASIEGAIIHLYIGDVDRTAVMNWLAAGPIVIFGAPIGTYLVSILPRIRVLYFVSALCVFQFRWTLQQTAKSESEWWFVADAMIVAALVLAFLYRNGKERETALAPIISPDQLQ